MTSESIVFVISFSNEPELTYLHTSITVASIQLNVFNYPTLIIPFNISNLFADSKAATSTATQHYSVLHHPFARSQNFPSTAMQYEQFNSGILI